jgi:hypothetical protein
MNKCFGNNEELYKFRVFKWNYKNKWQIDEIENLNI